MNELQEMSPSCNYSIYAKWQEKNTSNKNQTSNLYKDNLFGAITTNDRFHYAVMINQINICIYCK